MTTTRWLVWVLWTEQPVIGHRADGRPIRYPNPIECATRPEVFDHEPDAQHAANRLRRQHPDRTIHIETRTG